ncbi:MAG: hypothetical protein ACYDCL_00765 [Myxococcales bacterium]
MSRWTKAPMLAALLAACGNPKHDVASHYVKSQLIPSAQGGAITVGPADDVALAGTSIVIPPGALTADTTITIAEGASPVAPAGAQAAGPVVTFGPDGTQFRAPATITLPYDTHGAPADRLEIEAVESNGVTTTFTPAQLTLNAAASTVAFAVNGFTSYGGFVPPAADGGTAPCRTDADCPSGEFCVNGVCTAACSAGETVCGGACTDLLADPANCGACGSVCSSGVCSKGACAAAPTDGGSSTACVSDADCPSGESCVNGICTAACIAGETVCGGACTDLLTDPANCGACGNVCSSRVCSNGACAAAPADGGSSTACVSDADCPSGESCVGGVCSAMDGGVHSCTVCGGTCTDLSTDPLNCGACGSVCASRVCSNGVCS